MDARGSVDWAGMVLVGRIARSHGIRGQVVVIPETDFVEERFHEGAKVWCRTARGEKQLDEQLTVAGMRIHKGRPIVAFDGFTSINDIERLIGAELRIPEAALQPLSDGAYYHHQLIGCAVDTIGGERIGEVVRVGGGSSGSLLEIEGPRGQVLVPLAAEICVDIDVRGKRIRIDPPEGLLDVNA